MGGTTRIDIEPDLTVMACPMSDEVLGNLAEQTFEEMWFSERAERIRAEDRPYCVKWLCIFRGDSSKPKTTISPPRRHPPDSRAYAPWASRAGRRAQKPIFFFISWSIQIRA
jgi:hypothetical protein